MSEQDREPTPLESLRDLLMLVCVTVSLDAIASWTPTQREDAGDWAAATYLRASDNPVRLPAKPAFLPAEVG